MLRSWLITAFRNLLRRKFYSLVNLTGLSVGLASTLLVILLLRHEFSYDSYHSSADRTYRIAGKRNYGWFPSIPLSYSNEIHAGTFPEVEQMTRFRKWPSKFLASGDSKFYEEKVLITDPRSSFFQVFDVEFLEGDAGQAMNRPNSIVISEKLARKIFNEKPALGEILRYDTMQLTITGVMKDLPSNTHLVMEAMITNEWAMQRANGALTYCVLHPDASIENFESKLLALKQKKESDKLAEIELQKLPSIHFDSNMTYELKPAGNKMYIFLFAAIGLVVLLITVINYVNLSIAIYAERTREIAVRKTLGGSRSSIAMQVLSEALLIAMISLPVSMAIADIALPWINATLQINLGQHIFDNTFQVFALIALTLLTGLFSGAYPALVVPRYKTVSLFKGAMPTRSGFSFRKKLMLVQFSTLAALCGCSWIIYQQLEFIQNRKLGFDKDQVLKLTNAWGIDSAHYRKLKIEFLEDPHVASVSTGTVPGDDDYGIPFKSENAEEVYDDLISISSDQDFLKTMGITIVDGPGDPSQWPDRIYLVNETLATRLGTDKAIGTGMVIHPGETWESKRTIAGVFRDFHFFSLHQTVSPQALSLRKEPHEYVNQNILIRLSQPTLAATTRGHIQKALDQIVPNDPVQIEFLNDDLEKFYKKEQNLTSLANVLVIVAMITSFIGLIGFTSYVAELRTKEIGIRKVLGATTANIVSLLTSSFTAIVFIATLIGSIAAWFLSDSWLQIFSYKIELNVGTFLTTGGLVIAVALAVTVLHSLKVSMTNPVESLRSE